MADYGNLNQTMWAALKELWAADIDLHPKTAKALIEKGLAKKVRTLPSKRVVCSVTPKGKKHFTTPLSKSRSK